MYGIDVVSKRLSLLDKEVIKFALDWKGTKCVVEFGAGSGRLSLILALLGYRVFIYDKVKPFFIEQLNDLDLRVGFKSLDIGKIKPSDLPEIIGIFVAERVLHFLRFSDTKRVLKIVLKRMEKGGRLFVSFSGLNSPLGEGYTHKDLPIEERFCLPSKGVMEKFKIDVSVCLYTLEDVERLFDGLSVRKVFLRETPFGNVEGIFEKI